MDSHEAFLQAAGGDYRRAAQLIRGTAIGPTALELAIVELARKSVESPRLLSPADLEPLRACVGDGALDYLYVLMSFHFINRIADLLHVPPEAIPERLRGIEPLRKLGVRMAARIIGGSMDLKNRTYESGFSEQIGAIRWLLAEKYRANAEAAFGAFANRPKVVEAMGLAIESRRRFAEGNPEGAETVRRVVQSGLPGGREEIEGLHGRPGDPVEAFAFVGTRYAQRTTEKMIDALRGAGYDDAGILDLAVAVADGNQWERCWRLAGLERGLYWD